MREYVELKINIQGSNLLWKFFVVPNLSSPIVLGIDWSSAYKVHTDCAKQSLAIGVDLTRESEVVDINRGQSTDNLQGVMNSSEVNQARSVLDINKSKKDMEDRKAFGIGGNKFLPNTKEGSTTGSSLRLKYGCQISPKSCRRVKIHAISKICGDVIVTLRKELEYLRHIAVEKSIVHLTNGLGYVYLTILTNKVVRVPRNTNIGACEILESDAILCNMDELELVNKVYRSVISKRPVADQPTMKELKEALVDGNTDTKEFCRKVKFENNLTMEQVDKLKDLLSCYMDVFTQSYLPIGQTDRFKHRIEVGNTVPIKQRAYRVGYEERREITKQVNEMLEKNILEFSDSPWSSPVVLVRKKDRTLRFCVDYRKLNAETKKDNYPLPRIDDALDRLSGAKFFTSVDCDQAYHQVEMEEADKEKTAFITPDGLYQFKVMSFGLRNAPATFQRLMDFVLGKLKWSIAVVYLDGVVIFSENFEDHLDHIELVFQALRKAGLKLKPSKCRFGDDKLLYLGHIITPNGVKVNPDKIRAVTEFPVPREVKDVQSFVSLCSYYRRFVPNFSKIVQTLTMLTRKGQVFKWNDECNLAFQTLKDAVVNANCLAYPREGAPTEIHTDASKHGLGATLVQIQDGQERVVCFASRSLQKYEITQPRN